MATIKIDNVDYDSDTLSRDALNNRSLNGVAAG